MSGGPETLPLFGQPVELGLLPEQLVPPTRPETTPAAPPLTDALVIDPIAHAAEITRFYRRVVFGPDEHCAIWTGSISDDGYGTFSITRDGRESARSKPTVSRWPTSSACRWSSGR